MSQDAVIIDNKDIAMTVVAVGPGDPRMLTMRGRQALEVADLVVGFKTVLDVVTEWCGNAELRPMSYRDQEEVLEYAAGQVRERSSREVRERSSREIRRECAVG